MLLRLQGQEGLIMYLCYKKMVCSTRAKLDFRLDDEYSTCVEYSSLSHQIRREKSNFSPLLHNIPTIN